MIQALPRKPLTNLDILQCVRKLNLLFFRGVFMRDQLPQQINENETGVVNLDSVYGRGTHWVCYIKRGYFVDYFDSFGNLSPPLELQTYFNSGIHKVMVKYNFFPKQKENTTNCGHLCLDFLARQSWL